MIYVDLNEQLETIWEALEMVQSHTTETQWDDICYSMAVIKENLEIDEKNT
jgi:hypothetical protein